MTYKERVFGVFYSNTGEEIARIRIKFENHKNVLLWSTVQLEGLVLGKWLPLIRYDFDPKDKIPVHVNREYISTNDKKNKSPFKSPFNCKPKDLTSTAFKFLISIPESKILDLIVEREKVFLDEGK